MKRIFTKISLSYFLLITLLTSLIVYFSYDTIRSHYLDASAENLKNYAKIIEQKIDEINMESNRDFIRKTVNEISSAAGIRITIIREDGVVFIDSEEDYTKMENHIDRPEIISAKKNKSGRALRFSNTVKEDMLYVALKSSSNENIVFIRTSFFVKDMNQLIHEVRREIIEIAVFVYLLSFIGLIIFSRTISKPLKQLSFASRKLASGDFDVKVKIKTNDELGELSSNFNNMAKRLKKLFNKVNSQKEELDTLISSIQEGLVVLNQNGKIKLYNESFADLIEKDNIKGKKLKKLIKNKNLVNLFKDAINNDSSITREIEVDNHFFLCSSSWIKIKKEVIILLHDITELKKLELIKKDFVINVSHELRTPLTAIKGFTETLIDNLNENDDENLRYAEIIIRHANRLINIVNDLLTLSEIQDSSNTLLLRDIKISDLIDNVYSLFTIKAERKDLELIKEVENPDDSIELDVFRIEQVFVNLIDNAIKYTDSGYVKFKTYRENEDQIFIIEDTGLGIPDEDIDRIFERFYTVDKSHSRKVGGTGLGLSIVKHIILSHNGKIKIESKRKEGSKFIITLPVSQTQNQ